MYVGFVFGTFFFVCMYACIDTFFVFFRSGRERNRSRKIKVEAPRLDFENLAVQLTSTEKRHYPWLSNDDSV